MGASSPRMASQLEEVVRNWDGVAQPIQVSAQSRGTDHNLSHRIVPRIRNLAIDLFNDHGFSAITLAPGEECALLARLVYPADATSPQVLSLLTVDLSTCLPMSILKALSSGTVVAMCLLPSVALAGPFGFHINDKTRPDRRYDYCRENPYTSNLYTCTNSPKPNPSVNWYVLRHYEETGYTTVQGIIEEGFVYERKANSSVLNALINKYGIYDGLDKDHPGFNEIYFWLVDANDITSIEYQVSHEEERVLYFTIHDENMKNDSF